MGFRLPDSFYKKQKRINDSKVVIYKDKEIHVTEFENKSITPEMYEQMRMNSYARDDIFSKLTDETLIETALYYLSNCQRANYPTITYDESLIHKIVPELLNRLKEYTHKDLQQKEDKFEHLKEELRDALNKNSLKIDELNKKYGLKN